MSAEVHKFRSWPMRALIVLTAPLWFPVWWFVGVIVAAWHDAADGGSGDQWGSP